MIENDQQLKDRIKLINTLISEVNEYVGPDDPDEYDSREFLIEIPKKYIRKLSYFENCFQFLKDPIVRKNISYALQLSDFNSWILNRTDISLSVRDMFIKESIILLGSIAEAVLVTDSKGKLSNKLTFRERTQRYLEMGLITEKLKLELDWLWKARNFVHINKADEKEFGKYSDEMYTRAINACMSLSTQLSKTTLA